MSKKARGLERAAWIVAALLCFCVPSMFDSLGVKVPLTT
jgi:hypothetical protein